MAEEKKLRGRGKTALLYEQLYRALADAEVLQKVDKAERGPTFISEMKLTTARILTLQREITRRENSSRQQLKDENTRLKQDNAALRLQLETLKTQRPVVPAAPAKDPQVEKMLAEAAARRQRIATAASEAAAPLVRPTPLPTKGDSFDPELSRRNFPSVSLTPPREEELVQLPAELALPRLVVTPAEFEKKAIAASCNQFNFNDDRTRANVERIQAEARRTAEASKSQVSIIT